MAQRSCTAPLSVRIAEIGVDVAIEALKEYLGKRGRSMEALEQAAEVCRVGRVIRPYVEALA